MVSQVAWTSSLFVAAIEPITETDDEIRQALQDAEIPPLLPAAEALHQRLQERVDVRRVGDLDRRRACDLAKGGEEPDPHAGTISRTTLVISAATRGV